jgi:hypothetical protein
MKDIMNCDFCSAQQVIDTDNDENTWWTVGRPAFGEVDFDVCPDCFKEKINPLLESKKKNN